jgi:hypothetical protein
VWNFDSRSKGRTQIEDSEDNIKMQRAEEIYGPVKLYTKRPHNLSSSQNISLLIKRRRMKE